MNAFLDTSTTTHRMDTSAPSVAPLPATKRCPTCKHSLPLEAFGRDKSRPPLFRQGRCRPCVTSASSASRARTAERKQAMPLDFAAELAAINLELRDAVVTHRKDPRNPLTTLAFLVVPMRDRRRSPVAYKPRAREAHANWRALLLPPTVSRACVNKNTPKVLLK